MLSGSEVLLAHAATLYPGDRASLRGSTTLCAEVDLGRLGVAALAAAFLGAERAGAIELRIATKRVWLIMQASTLHAGPAGAATFPGGSLEDRIVAALRERGESRVPTLVRDLFTGPHATPERLVVDAIEAGLRARGLLADSGLTDAGAAASRATDAEPLSHLLAQTPAARPQTWRLLEMGVRQGLAALRPPASSAAAEHP